MDRDECQICISIHAPREGSDGGTVGLAPATLQFLSTLPARGATDAAKVATNYITISIHAPREGSDRPCWTPSSPPCRFLSTLPARGATFLTALWLCTYDAISIHAPREGSDLRGEGWSCKDRHFYPRSPRGERPVPIRLLYSSRYFYPRSPRGERRYDGRRDVCDGNFYPRSPRGERPQRLFQNLKQPHISIHAPREGSDFLALRCNVQSRPISIHAPREGSDALPGEGVTPCNTFLSTLPARGATAKPNKNTVGFCAKGPNADLRCTKREGHFCAISMIFLRAGAVRRGFAGANLPVGPCALGLRTGGGRRPDYTSSTSSWDHCGARPMCSTRVL